MTDLGASRRSNGGTASPPRPSVVPTPLAVLGPGKSDGAPPRLLGDRLAALETVGCENPAFATGGGGKNLAFMLLTVIFAGVSIPTEGSEGVGSTLSSALSRTNVCCNLDAV